MAGVRDIRELVAWQLARFVRIAKGSEVEVLNHFIDGVDKRYIARDELPTLERAARRALKAATGLIRYLESTPDPRLR